MDVGKPTPWTELTTVLERRGLRRLDVSREPGAKHPTPFSKQSVTNMCNGHQNPTPGAIQAMAEALDVPVETLTPPPRARWVRRWVLETPGDTELPAAA